MGDIYQLPNVIALLNKYMCKQDAYSCTCARKTTL